MRPPYSIEDREQLTNESYMNIGVEPYSSSSIIFMRSPSYGKRVMNLFVVTIDLKFIEFVVDGNNGVTKQIIKVNEI